MLAPGTVLQNRYQIVRQLGTGGMGAVYEARHIKLKHRVAVNETFFSEAHLTRAFEHEAQLLAGLHHPALPKVSDYFSEGDGYFLVMDFVPGTDLNVLLAERGQVFPVAQVAAWADQVLDALEYLHRRTPPVIHRDIKPANIKVTVEGKVFLLDFGLAKGLHTQMSRATGAGRSSVQAYTPGYAPVEQMQGTGTDARSDVFSLGATLYHLMTGTPPVDALTRGMNVVNGDPDPLRPAHAVNAQIRPELSAVLHKALALQPERRPTTATEFRRMLREAAREVESVKPVKLSGPMPGNLGNASGEAETVLDTEPPAWTADAAPMPPQSVQTLVPPVFLSPSAKSQFVPDEKTATVKSRAWGVPLMGAIGVIGLVISFIIVSQNLAPNETNQPATPVIPSAIPTGSFKNSIGMEFVKIPAGSFQMGSPENEAGRGNTEKLPHLVTFSQPIYFGKYEVTQAEWLGVMGNNPSSFKGDRLPVETVSWNDCQAFLKKLNAKKDGYTYRLPGEAEWEYACRAGTKTPFSFGETITTDQGNYDGTAPFGSVPAGANRGKTMPVGSFPANAWGLHEMHGNVREWCQDQYQPSSTGVPAEGIVWEDGPDAQLRILRGGFWHTSAEDCRSASRAWSETETRVNFNGLRVVAIKTVND